MGLYEMIEQKIECVREGDAMNIAEWDRSRKMS